MTVSDELPSELPSQQVEPLCRSEGPLTLEALRPFGELLKSPSPLTSANAQGELNGGASDKGGREEIHQQPGLEENRQKPWTTAAFTKEKGPFVRRLQVQRKGLLPGDG